MTERLCKKCNKPQGGYKNGGNMCRLCYNEYCLAMVRIKRGTPPEKFKLTGPNRPHPLGTCYDCGGELRGLSRCSPCQTVFARRYQPRATKCRVCGLDREEGSRLALCLMCRRAEQAARDALRGDRAEERKAKAIEARRKRAKLKSGFNVAPPVAYVGQRVEQVASASPIIVGPEAFTASVVVVVGGVRVTKCPPTPDADWAERTAGRRAAVAAW